MGIRAEMRPAMEQLLDDKIKLAITEIAQIAVPMGISTDMLARLVMGGRTASIRTTAIRLMLDHEENQLMARWNDQKELL